MAIKLLLDINSRANYNVNLRLRTVVDSIYKTLQHAQATFIHQTFLLI